MRSRLHLPWGIAGAVASGLIAGFVNGVGVTRQGGKDDVAWNSVLVGSGTINPLQFASWATVALVAGAAARILVASRRRISWPWVAATLLLAVMGVALASASDGVVHADDGGWQECADPSGRDSREQSRVACTWPAFEGSDDVAGTVSLAFVAGWVLPVWPPSTSRRIRGWVEAPAPDPTTGPTPDGSSTAPPQVTAQLHLGEPELVDASPDSVAATDSLRFVPRWGSASFELSLVDDAATTGDDRDSVTVPFPTERGVPGHGGTVADPPDRAAVPTTSARPAWHADPFRRFELRYWDGTAWTEHVVSDGEQRLDPVDGAAAPDEAASGWYPDTTGRHELRYWDGAAWTEHVSTRGQAGVDPIVEDSGAASVPGWHPDPHGRHELRYWDGRTWTEHVVSGGRQQVDPG